MTRYNCLIVDDEPIARDIIKEYCLHLAHLNVVASCGDALQAKSILHQQAIDVIFLDINMPVIDGVSFAKTLKSTTQIIFTTAYKEYATDAFDIAACDYLLKPFSFERFIIAVDKAVDKLSGGTIKAQSGNPEAVSNPVEDFIFIKTNGKIYKIMHHELLYAEAQGNYTRIVLENQVLMPKISFTDFEELLKGHLFLRSHRSFIINKSKIDHIEGNRIFIKQAEIPIGSNYKEPLLKELGL